MIQSEIERGRIGFVEVPFEANRFTLFNDADRPYISYFIGVETFREYLTQGNWQLLCLSTELTEEHLKDVMPKLINRYQDFMDSKVVHTFSLSTATESFKSLKQILGVVDKAGYPDCGCMGPSEGCKGCDEYEAKQSKVRKYVTLFEPKK